MGGPIDMEQKQGWVSSVQNLFLPDKMEKTG